MSDNSFLAITSDEKVLKTVQRHWINILPVVFSCLLLVLLLLASTFYTARYADVLQRYHISPASIELMIILGFVLIGLIGLAALWIYSQNKIILTTNHLIQITQNGLFNHTVSQLSLAKIQDVSAAKKGPIAMMLGYGVITIETAGEEENFTFYQVPDPYQLAKDIMQAHEAIAHHKDGVADSGRDDVEP